MLILTMFSNKSEKKVPMYNVKTRINLPLFSTVVPAVT